MPVETVLDRDDLHRWFRLYFSAARVVDLDGDLDNLVSEAVEDFENEFSVARLRRLCAAVVTLVEAIEDD